MFLNQSLPCSHHFYLTHNVCSCFYFTEEGAEKDSSVVDAVQHDTTKIIGDVPVLSTTTEEPTSQIVSERADMADLNSQQPGQSPIEASSKAKSTISESKKGNTREGNLTLNNNKEGIAASAKKKKGEASNLK